MSNIGRMSDEQAGLGQAAENPSRDQNNVSFADEPGTDPAPDKDKEATVTPQMAFYNARLSDALHPYKNTKNLALSWGFGLSVFGILLFGWLGVLLSVMGFVFSAIGFRCAVVVSTGRLRATAGFLFSIAALAIAICGFWFLYIK